MPHQLSEIVARTTAGPSASFVSVDLPEFVGAGDVDAARDVDRVPVTEAGAIITRDTLAALIESRRARVPASVTDAAIFVAGYAVSALAGRVAATIADVLADPHADPRTREMLDSIAATYARKEPDLAAEVARSAAIATARGSELAGNPIACNLATGSALMVALVNAGPQPSPVCLAAHLVTARVLDSIAADRADAERIADEIRRAIEDGETPEGKGDNQ